jgi:hypothetical protein
VLKERREEKMKSALRGIATEQRPNLNQVRFTASCSLPKPNLMIWQAT